MPNPNESCCRTFLRSIGEPERTAPDFVAVISHSQCRLQLKLWCSDLDGSRHDELEAPSSGPTWRHSFFKERSRRTASNVIEPILTMDILDRAVVSWVGTLAGFLSGPLEMHWSTIRREPDAARETMIERYRLDLRCLSCVAALSPPAASLESRGMAMKSLEHDDDHALPNAQNFTLKRRLLDGDCKFAHLPIPAGLRREQCDGF